MYSIGAVVPIMRRLLCIELCLSCVSPLRAAPMFNLAVGRMLLL